MTTIFRHCALALAAVASVVAFVPAVAAAQTTNAQVVVITQTNYGVNPMSGSVTVNGSGPSLNGTPSNTSSLNFSADFTSDSHVVTLVPGNYSIFSSTYSNQNVTYSSDCNGYISAGQSRTCTITSTVGVSGNARVNVSVNVINNGSNKVAGDFTVLVSGSNVNVSSFPGSTGTTQVMLGSGGYSIDINNPGSYGVTRSADCSGTIGSSDTRSCVITLTQGAYNYNNYSNNNYNYIGNPSGVYYINGSTCYYTTTYYSGSNCYRGTVYGNTYQNYYPTTASPLSCVPAAQTVDNGQTASFTALGGSGPFTWTLDGRSFFAVGPQLNTVVSGPGVHTVQVSNGYQTASCAVTVTNKQYVLGGVILGSATVIPGLPNTGYEPSTVGFALALLGALVAFPLALLMAYRYAKKSALTLSR